MNVFVTGASGYIGQAVVKELLAHGHRVSGMTRSEEGARQLESLGAQVHRATLEQTDNILDGVRQADGVIHLAFNHDFTRFVQSCEEDQRLIDAMCGVLTGSQKPLIVTSGVLVLDVPAGTLAKEDSPRQSSGQMSRAGSEEAVARAAARGVRASVARLSQVHDVYRQGLISYALALGKQKGELARVGDGENQVAAVHLDDAARLYRLALERAGCGEIYHGVGESGVKAIDIARTAGQRLGLPVKSIPQAQAASISARCCAWL